MGARPTGTVTFLFTDIVSSVGLWEQAPGAMGDALERHDRVVRETIASHAGYVFSTGGDAFSVAFERAGDAAGAAIAVQRRLQAEQWPATAPITVRMGIHTGEAVERDGDYFGPAVNVAARLMAAAHGGQVIVSSATREILAQGLPHDVALVDLGEHRLRGVALAQRVFGVDAPGLASHFPPLRTERALTGNLPVPVSRLIGREEEIATLGASLRREARVVTLTGTGGVGKTRLALAVGAALRDEFPDGVWWVELAPVGRESDVAAVVAASVGVRPQGGVAAEALVLALEGRRLLLVLDNCEHVLDATTSLVDTLARRCPTLTMLTTSRERLGVDGEHVVAVRPLGYQTLDAPAVELLVERIDDAQVVADPAERPALMEICARLDGVPLAIELAAARCRVMGPSEVVTRLADRFRLLQDRHRRQDRHQTLRATVEWSYDLLSERERRLFDRLSVFAGGFSLEAAEAVCAGDDLDAYDVDEVVGSLVDKSLVEREGKRYRLLETTRQFAAEQLERDDGMSRVGAAYVAFFTEFVHRTCRGLQGPDEAAWDVWLSADWDNVRASFQSACDREDVSAASAIVTDLVLQGLFRQSEALLWTEEAYQRFGAVEHPKRPQLVGAAGYAAWALGDAACVERAELSAVLAADADTAPNYLPEWAQLAGALFSGEAHRTVDLCAATAERARAAGHQWNEALWLTNVAISLMFAGRAQEAVGPAREAVVVAQASRNPTATAWALFCEGSALSGVDPDRALECLEQAQDIAVVVGNRYVRNEALRLLGPSRARLMEPEAALATLVGVAEDYRRGGYIFHVWLTISAVPTVLVRVGRIRDAAVVVGAARAAPGAANRVFTGSLDRTETAVVAHFGQEQCAELTERGRHLTAAQVIAFIRGSAS